MFNSDFYPTPLEVINIMLGAYDLQGKTVLEPSSGKGDIIDALKAEGANVICCEVNPDLATISASKAQLIANDFLKVTSEQISHVDYIVMNPPFSADEHHINHAWNIAPAGCQIVALCNWETLRNDYSKSRRQLTATISNYGYSDNIGDLFSDAERSTGIDIGLIRLTKPGVSEDFSDFFSEEDDEIERQENGIMSYNAVREVVQRYVNAIRLYDEVLVNAVKMSELTSHINTDKLVFTCSRNNVSVAKTEFMLDLQKRSWDWIFSKMNMGKFITRGVREDINRFVEQQKSMKFTMKNIYKMLDVIIQTSGQRMDKALLEVFDRLTQRYHENRYNLEGWKTNSHYLVNQRFIIDGVCWQDQRWYKGDSKIQMDYSSGYDYLNDLVKALCFLTGKNYDHTITLRDQVKGWKKLIDKEGNYIASPQYNNVESTQKSLAEKGIYTTLIEESDYEYGKWFNWTFFECKAFKKGTMHFKFKDENVWALFNQQIARIKGFPLPESIRKAA